MKVDLGPIALVVTSLVSGSLRAQPFPGELPGTPIGFGLPAAFQASAVTWHPRVGRLFAVGDEGTIATLEANGTLVESSAIGGDLEALALANPDSEFVYVGVEHPDSILEWNVVTRQVTRTFLLTPWMTSLNENQGLEGLTFLPDASDVEGGTFLAGLQADGKLYRFRLPIATSATNTSVEFLGSWTPIPGRIDLRSVEYDRATDRLYLAWVEFDRISQHDRNGVLLAEWELPGTKPEGIAVRGCELFVAEDNGSPTIVRYGSFPSTSPCAVLESDARRVSASAGGVVQFTAHAKAPLGPGAEYLLLGSASGTGPGPVVNGSPLSLTPDTYFLWTIVFANAGPFERTLGQIGDDGFAAPRLVVPAAISASLIGTSLHHAWIGGPFESGHATFASPSVSLTIVP